MKAASHPDEAARLAALHRYEILDTPPEDAFDSITRVIAYVCDAPIALISLVDGDRQWFKSRLGMAAAQTPLELSICAHAILQQEVLIVEDLQSDARFADNPLVCGDPHVRFYAGAPLRSTDGQPLGTLCVLDYEPRRLTEAQVEALKALAQQAMSQIELRRALWQKELLLQEVHHRVKNNLAIVSSLLSLEEDDTDDAAARARLEDAQSRIYTISLLHDRLQQLEAIDRLEFGAFLRMLCADLEQSFARRALTTIQVGELVAAELSTDQAVPAALLVNELVTNAVRHGRVAGRPLTVTVSFLRRSDGHLMIEVRDDGAGLPAEIAATASDGMGSQFIPIFARQLGGRLEIDSPQGTRIRVTLSAPESALR